MALAKWMGELRWFARLNPERKGENRTPTLKPGRSSIIPALPPSSAAVAESGPCDRRQLASNCTSEAWKADPKPGALGPQRGGMGRCVVVLITNKPPQDGLRSHFPAIATAAPALPVMLYTSPVGPLAAWAAGNRARSWTYATSQHSRRPSAAPMKR